MSLIIYELTIIAVKILLSYDSVSQDSLIKESMYNVNIHDSVIEYSMCVYVYG